MGEVAAAFNDPNIAIQIGIGPPCPELVPQQPHTGLSIGGRFEAQPKRFVFKKAHVSAEDFRIFDASNGRPVAAMHHFGKNPYAAADPLGQSAFVNMHNNRMGEWESLCHISGFQGMPGLRVRPKALSRHGRQLVQSVDGNHTYFNIAKESRLKEMSIRHNLAVCAGEGEEPLYRIKPDMMGRTIVIDNAQGQQVCFVQKTVKALLMTAALGSGSEMVMDVAPGVDWTAMVAVVLALNQVGEHFVKDAFSNWVMQPLQGQAIDGALQATGLSDEANQLGNLTNQGMRFMQKAQHAYNMFK